MSDAFFISTNDREIKREKGKQATFAVCHREEEQRLVKVAVYADPKGFEKWLKVKDPVERQMAPHQFEEYIVELTPQDEPRDDAPFEFGLRAMWEEDTDEKCTEGPSVKVKGVEKKRLWWIAAVVGAALVTAVAAVLLTLYFSNRATVPMVRQWTYAEAESVIQSWGLKSSPLLTPDGKLTPAIVEFTTPAAGERVHDGSTVSLVVAGEVPVVIGMPVATAQAALVQAGLKADSVMSQPDAEVPADLVMGTTPGPGTFVREGSHITLIASEGEKPPTVRFLIQNNVGKVPLTVEFEDKTESVAEDSVWLWDFGDGGTSDKKSGTHAYTTPGDFTVRLTVSTAQGQGTWEVPDYVHAYAVKPVADFEAPSTVWLGDSVEFRDKSTNVPTERSWDFGDGTTSDEQNPSHRYLWTETFTVKLTVTNTADVDTKINTITVKRPICLEQQETEWTENDEEAVSCPDGFVAGGVECQDDYCGKMRLICCRYRLGGEKEESPDESNWFSEEGDSNLQYSQGGWLQGLACRGDHCDDLKLMFVETPYLTSTSEQCRGYVRFSDEAGGIGTCPYGEYVAGLKCTRGVTEFFRDIQITPLCQFPSSCCRRGLFGNCTCSCPAQSKVQSLWTESRGKFCDEIQLWCCPAQ